MTAKIVEALLRIPPFPGAASDSLAVPADFVADLSDEELDGLIAQCGQAGVGGTFWARQPALPSSYVLFRSNAASEASLYDGDEQVVRWVEGEGAGERGGLTVSGQCDPWHMVGAARLVVAPADDELLLIAAIAGVPVRCLGEGRFASLESGPANPSALRLAFRREVVESFRYRSPFTGSSIELSEAIALCGFWRGLVDANRDISAAIGFASWKRATVEALLWHGDGPIPFRSRPNRETPGAVALWRSRASAAALHELEQSGTDIIEVEDGFIRSAGLGADCVPPLSIVADRRGIYFDPGQASDLEELLETGTFPSELTERARELRGLVVGAGISKYAVGETALDRRCPDRRHILVPGQVEDDRAVLSGRGPATNLQLLERVRAEAPDAYIIYKPHPDVEAGHRVGRVDEQSCLRLADEVLRDQSIASVIAMVDEVHVNTSLAGFEALLREKRVVTYGVPFYAGWGLTVDRGPVPPRRSARRTLDELVAATLLLYPRYLDPVTRLPCPPEVLILRLSEGAPDPGGLLVKLRRAQGSIRRRISDLLRASR